MKGGEDDLPEDWVAGKEDDQGLPSPHQQLVHVGHSQLQVSNLSSVFYHPFIKFSNIYIYCIYLYIYMYECVNINKFHPIRNF